MEVLCLRDVPWSNGRKGPAFNEICEVEKVVTRPVLRFVEAGTAHLEVYRFYKLKGYDEKNPATGTGFSIFNEMFFEPVMEEVELREELRGLRITTLRSTKLKAGERGFDFYEYTFYCPGCQCLHGFITKDWPMPEGLSTAEKNLFNANKWTWNGDLFRPTVTPKFEISKLVEGAVDLFSRKIEYPVYETICRFYVKEGLLIYLGDCKHELKSLQIEMLDI